MRFTIFSADGKAVRRGKCDPKDIALLYDAAKGEVLKPGLYKLWKPGKPIEEVLECAK